MILEIAILEEIIKNPSLVYVLAVIAEYTPSKATTLAGIELSGVEVTALPGLIFERFQRRSDLVVIDGLLSVLYNRYGLIKSADTSTKIVCTGKGMWVYAGIEEKHRMKLLSTNPGMLQIETS